MDFRPYRSIFVCAILLLLFSLAGWAQGVGSITGIVYDPTGAVVPNVSVTLTNDATHATYKSETTSAGLYRFSQLPVVGTYTLSVDTKGFAPFKATDMVVSVGSVTTLDINLKLGQETQVIDVNAQAQMVTPSESQVSQLIDHNIWDTMPNNTRDSNAFVNLVAGAIPDNGSTRGASVNGARGGTGNFLVEGMDNNDQGQGGRGQVSPDSEGGAIVNLSMDAIQEYRVITNNFSAEYGKAGGFVTDTVLKSGTNKFHGSAYEYNRIQALAANNFFTNRAEDPLNPGHHQNDRLVRNQFGGSIGGPVIKDKTFFFATGEVHRRRSSTVASAVGVNPAFYDWVNTGGLQKWAESDPNGICMHNNGAPCPGAFSHSATVGPVFKSLIQKSPFPFGNTAAKPCNDPSAPCVGKGMYSDGLLYPMSPYADLFLQDPNTFNEFRVSTKVDHKVGVNDVLNAMFLIQDGESTGKFDGGGNTIGPESINRARSMNAGVSWNHTFSPTFMNTFKASYLRHVSNFPETAPGMPEIYTWLDPLTVGLGMYGGEPQFFTDNQFQFQNHLTKVHGKNTFKFGGEYRRIRNGSEFHNVGKGSFYPYGVEDLLSDLYFSDEADLAVFGKPTFGSVMTESAAVDLSNGKEPIYYRGYRANEMAAYFQNDWRLTNRLTLNMGLRWEYFGPPHNFKENVDSNFFFGTNVAPFNTATTNPYFPTNNTFYAGVANGAFQIRNNEIWNKDTNNFAPRFGFAWDILGNQKLVMRGGAAIAYDRIYNNIFENIRFNPPYYSVNTIGHFQNNNPGGALSTPGLYQYPFVDRSGFNNAKYAPKPNPRHMDQNVVAPYYEQFHLGFQYEFAKGYMFQPEYVGTFGHKLLGIRDINTFSGRTAGIGSSARINTTIGADNYRSNDYSSNYHGLQLTVRKNYSNGLSFNSAYTWSKAMDSISDVFQGRGTTAVTDPMNVKADYGPADFDIRHRWVSTVTYELPFMKKNRLLGGWSVNSILSFQTGAHFSPFSSASSYDVNKNGLFTDRLVTTGGDPMSTVVTMDKQFGAFGNGVTYFNADGWTTATCPLTVNNGKWCDAPIGRNSMTGPGLQNIDLGLSKKFVIREGMDVTLQVNSFNFLNHTNFNLPSYNLNGGNFGEITSTATAARQTQLALRFDF